MLVLICIPLGACAGEVLYEGSLTLSEEPVEIESYVSGVTYEIPGDSPLGLLGSLPDLDIAITDKSYDTKGILLLDGINSYTYDKASGKSWVCEVNGIILNDWENPDTDGLNVKKIHPGDSISFYYGTQPVTIETAEAIVRFSSDEVSQHDDTLVIASDSDEWSLSLFGAREDLIDAAYFKEGKECADAVHMATWKDEEGNEWSGIPLWYIIGMVDDDESGGHYTFNDNLAEEGYSIKIIASDGWDTTVESRDIARNDGFIIADSVNDSPLPLVTDQGKPLWPLALKGSAVFGGQSVGSIASIELLGLTHDTSDWTLLLEGAVTEKINSDLFSSVKDSGVSSSWVDEKGRTYSGIPLWYLAGLVDDIATSTEPEFNKKIGASGYSLTLYSHDEKVITLNSQDIADSNQYILADRIEGEMISGEGAPLMLVGDAVSPGSIPSAITRITLSGLPEEGTGDWSLALKGNIEITINQPYFESAAKCHPASWTDEDGNEYTGIPLWLLSGFVDDRTPHGSDGYNDSLAEAGYRVIVKAGDGYAKDFTSIDIGTKDDDYIIANRINGEPLSTEGDHPPYPLRLVGNKVSGGFSVGNVIEIELTDFNAISDDTQMNGVADERQGDSASKDTGDVPSIKVIKYDTDGRTILNEITVDYLQLEEDFPVIGDGEMNFRYQGITNNPDDVWDEELTFPGGFKIDAKVKGTKIRDIIGLVGGMEPGTALTLVASDGYETKLAYPSIYPDPAALSLAGEAFLAWNKDGRNVPQYREGYQLFFTGGDDGIFTLWDMHETMDRNHWHYYWGDGGVQYASAAGLATKYVTEIHVFTEPDSEWELELSGSEIGGVDTVIASGYYDSGLVCQFGANHKSSFTDAEGIVWEGMPLWFLAGFVDDEDQHSNNAYNEEVAEDGYQIIIEGADGVKTSINSKSTIRNDDYLIASIRDGTRIPAGDSAWPLVLIGNGVSDPIGGVHSITLTFG